MLVVEDDPDMREIERATLGFAGHDVLLASNGCEALQTLEHRRPCVILLDLMMPVMDGLTFLRERQKRGLARGVPVLCVTAGGDDMTRNALDLGARECMHKPADIDELCEKVAQYCRPASD